MVLLCHSICPKVKFKPCIFNLASLVEYVMGSSQKGISGDEDSAASYKFFVLTTITSNTTTIKVVDATDVMAGVAIVANDSDATASIFETTSTSDTITFDGSTTGGILGATVELQDVATNLWSVRVVGAATGTEATPFSATVS